MDLLGSVISDLAFRLLDPITRHIGYLFKVDKNIHSLKKGIQELKNIRDDVKARVDATEVQLFLTCTNQVKGWLQQVEAIEGEVNEIEQVLNQRRRCLGDCHPNCWSSYKLSKRAVKKLSDVVELKSKGVFEIVAERSCPDAVEEMPSTSTVGTDVMLEKVMNFLREDAVGIIGIYGMGGVGKTTLLKKINNAFLQGTPEFDVVIWVVVSKEMNLGKIQKDIGDRLGLSIPEDATLESKATYLFKVLRKKKYLLLLDDVWKRLDLEVIGIPSPHNQGKCKIVFTTRSMDICSDMSADRKIKVDVLQKKEAWELFRDKVGQEGVVDSPSIRPIAMKITKKCGGLPLALITIGRAMANKTTIEEWKHAETMLHKNHTKLRGVQDEILDILKFSYDSLPDDTSKLCFLYFAMFPEDENIPIGLLIDYWIGEGFLNECDDVYEARNKGYDIIGTLKVACLLESGFYEETQLMMHDITRELALWIACECEEKKDKYLVQAGLGLTEAPRVDRWTGAERISLYRNDINALRVTPTCPNLLTLNIRYNMNLKEVCNGFFQFMPLLRVLDLSYSQLKHLPAEIGNLIELQYLDLTHSKIEKLPKELGNLVKLKHLSLSETYYLKQVPLELITGHLRLQVLNLHASNYGDWNEISLSKLEGWSWLNALGITIKTAPTLHRFLGSEILLERTQWLSIRDTQDLTNIHLSSTYLRMKRLQELSIMKCYKLEELMIGDEVEGKILLLSSLKYLFLFSLPKLKVIVVPPYRCLQNLRRLYIERCHELKNITWVVLLQNLERLELHQCNGMEDVIGSGAETGEGEMTALALPRIKLIEIIGLPELKSIFRGALAFPCMKQLRLIKCPKLKKLPLGPNSASKTLQGIYGQKTWWDGLEWDDDTIKSAFLPYFKEAQEVKE